MDSKLVWFGVATSLLGSGFLLYRFSKRKKPSHTPPPPPPPPRISPLLPPYTRLIASVLCPALAVLSVNPDGELTHSNRTVPSSGFISKSVNGNSVVWGSSLFLYDPELLGYYGSKKVREGRIVVTLVYPKSYGKFFEGMIVHLDYEYDLVAIAFKDSGYCYKPPASVAEMEPHVDALDPCLGLDFYPYLGYFLTEPYSFQHDSECESCRPFLHTQLGTQSSEGVILDLEKNIIGMKMTNCKIFKGRSHVLPMSFLYERLGSYTCRYLYIGICTVLEPLGKDRGETVISSVDVLPLNGPERGTEKEVKVGPDSEEVGAEWFAISDVEVEPLDGPERYSEEIVISDVEVGVSFLLL